MSPTTSAPARSARPKAEQASPAGGEPNRLLERGRPWVPKLAGFLALCAGLVNVFSALTPELHARLDDLRKVLPGSLSRSASAATVVAGLLLILLARGLSKRKRRAWRGVVVLLAASVVLHVLKGLDYEEAIASFVLLVAVVAERKEFRASGDPSTRWRALWVGLLLAATSIVLGLLLFSLRPSLLVGSHPLSAEFEHVLLGLVGVSGPLHFRSDRGEDFVTKVLFALGVFTLVVTAYLALRPPSPRPRLTADDDERMRHLLAKHGARDSLGYFALRSDKSVVWSPTGKSCVAYRVTAGVMLASGDPLGDPEAWPGAIKEFLTMAADHAWTPAVIGCSEAAGTAWTRAGLAALEFGDEAVVDLAEFSLEGRAMRNVRQAAGRVERAGYTCELRRVRDIPAAEQAELRAQARAWRGTERERGFSMALGRFGDERDGDCVAAMAFQRPDADEVAAGGTAGAAAASSGATAGGATAGGATAGSATAGSATAGAGGGAAAAAGAGGAGAAGGAGGAGCALPTCSGGAGSGEPPLLRALLHYVPWGEDGLSLDLMVRDRTADNGLNEFLIVQTLKNAKALGVQRLSLNFAFFRSALERGERLGAGPVLRAWRGILVFLSRWFQIDSLYRFNAKFRPIWEPRFVCYPNARDLPRIAVAMLEAEAFIERPHLRRRRVTVDGP